MICGAGYGKLLTSTSPLRRFDREVRHRLEDTFGERQHARQSSVHTHYERNYSQDSRRSASPTRGVGPASPGRVKPFGKQAQAQSTPLSCTSNRLVQTRVCSPVPRRQSASGLRPKLDASLSAAELAELENFAVFCRLKPTIDSDDEHAVVGLTRSPPWIIQSNRRRLRPVTHHAQRGAAQAQSTVTWGADISPGRPQSTVAFPLTLSSLTSNFIDEDGRRTTSYEARRGDREHGADDGALHQGASYSVADLAIGGCSAETVAIEKVVRGESEHQQQSLVERGQQREQTHQGLHVAFPKEVEPQSKENGDALPEPLPGKCGEQVQWWAGMEHDHLSLASVRVCRPDPGKQLRRVLRSPPRPVGKGYYQRVLCTPPDRSQMSHWELGARAVTPISPTAKKRPHIQDQPLNVDVRSHKEKRTQRNVHPDEHMPWPSAWQTDNKDASIPNQMVQGSTFRPWTPDAMGFGPIAM